ncbi:antA/AntB antirepressor family protein [Rhizobium sp. Leaf383]|uniref:antA/AntB antirepressor family protein n=1 Tax=Rhizobium sp. Leaf383 TaxID=1736357 RepID=UPI000712F817|nr:antA/AntB antirepressor family protein [Rhizobium sp. Leaf383]KQS83442.1 hypothetical protein ASG58_22170 [Rhizobium sp. Leaf383]
MNIHQKFPAIEPRTIGSQLVQTVDGREVHAFLKVGKDYSTWIKDRIKRYGFVEGVDFIVVSQSPISGSGNRGAKDEYHLTIGMGKEIGMVDRSAKGREIRKYFLAFEEKATAPARPMSPAEMFLQNAELMLNIERQAAETQRELKATVARIEAIEETAPLKAKPQNTETISEIRQRMNRKYGLPERIVNQAMNTLPYRIRPFAMVKNSHENAQGSSFAVYLILDVTKLFTRFAGECQQATETTCTHPAIDGRFKMQKTGTA